MRNPIARLTERVKLKNDLEAILRTPEGKRFFDTFLRHCHVSRPVFFKDPLEAAAAEGRRRLATSYLALLGEVNSDRILRIIEEETNRKENNNG